MRRINFPCLVVLIALLPYSQAAPAPKRTNAKPAVINAGTEKNIESVGWYLVNWARVAVREDEKVSKMDLIRRQKDWEAWLKKNLRAQRIKDTNLVHVSFQAGNAKEQAAIINVVVDYYMKNEVGQRIETEKNAIARRRRTLEARRNAGRITAEQAAESEEALKTREERIKTFPALVEHAKAP